MTTARDIAERLDLSVSTVGRALADDRRISAETKLRVQQVAEELGYVVNRAARMMRGARSPVVGLVVPDVRNSFYSTVAHALTETMGARNHQVMLCETGDDKQTELRQIRGLAAAQVSGVVIVPTAKPLPDITRAMGGDVVETLWHDGGYALIVYHSAEEVRALTPDLAPLSEGDILYIATAAGAGDPSGADVVSRAFAPGAGIPEDPVTGSAHCVLTPYWTTRLGRDAFAAYQASARGGHVGCRLTGDRVELTGRCVTTLVGEFLL